MVWGASGKIIVEHRVSIQERDREWKEVKIAENDF
jgi:hypothetical protein